MYPLLTPNCYTVELTSWNFPESQLRLESKTELSVANAPKFIGGAGTLYRKCILGGGTPHILFLMEEVETLHNI